jgi:hypothetical protein
VLLSFKLLEVELLLVFQLALVTFDIFFLWLLFQYLLFLFKLFLLLFLFHDMFLQFFSLSHFIEEIISSLFEQSFCFWFNHSEPLLLIKNLFKY